MKASIEIQLCVKRGEPMELERLLLLTYKSLSSMMSLVTQDPITQPPTLLLIEALIAKR